MKDLGLAIAVFIIAAINTFAVFIITRQTGEWFDIHFLAQIKFVQYFALILLSLLLNRGNTFTLATKADKEELYGHKIKSYEFRLAVVTKSTVFIAFGYLFIYLLTFLK